MNVNPASTNDPLNCAQQLGYFTWSVPENLLYADDVFAEIYEMPAKDLAAGIPVEAILFRIAETDRETIAARVHQAILSGAHSTSRYLIACPSGKRKTLVSMGRCFQDSEGVPSFFTGVVTLATDPMVAIGASPLEAHTRAALGIARQEGRELTERYLSSALRSLGKECDPV